MAPASAHLRLAVDQRRARGVQLRRLLRGVLLQRRDGAALRVHRALQAAVGGRQLRVAHLQRLHAHGEAVDAVLSGRLLQATKRGPRGHAGAAQVLVCGSQLHPHIAILVQSCRQL